jgi:hypothetical protein
VSNTHASLGVSRRSPRRTVGSAGVTNPATACAVAGLPAIISAVTREVAHSGLYSFPAARAARQTPDTPPATRGNNATKAIIYTSLSIL